MSIQKLTFRNEKELQEAILQEKLKGTSDVEIGRKYGVTLRYIEKLITKTYGLNVSAFKLSKKIKKLHPENFKEEQTTLWSFKKRGDWATHSGEYRGNWSPYIPRNIILRYSNPGDLVLDYFCGAGTTAVECKLLGRRCIAIDINEKAIELAKKKLDFEINCKHYEPELMVGDARDLSFLLDNSVDLICSHPPYANIIRYTNSKPGDLSCYSVDDFLEEMNKVAKESFRVLKPGKKCAILIGDLRRKKSIIPLGFKLIDIYLKAGFKLRELIIKRQHNCKTTGFWYKNSIKYNFLLIAHEYLLIFEKPETLTFSKHEEIENYEFNLKYKLEQVLLDQNIEKLETTTVWLFPEELLERELEINLISRYSKDGYYAIASFVHEKNGENDSVKRVQKSKNLLFIKFPFMEKNPSPEAIEGYLKKLKKVVGLEIPFIKKGGFLAIQAKDVRIDKYVEPIAKRIIDSLTFDSLSLKEIIIVAPASTDLDSKTCLDNLKIVHQYVIVYEVKG